MMHTLQHYISTEFTLAELLYRDCELCFIPDTGITYKTAENRTGYAPPWCRDRGSASLLMLEQHIMLDVDKNEIREIRRAHDYYYVMRKHLIADHPDSETAFFLPE